MRIFNEIARTEIDGHSIEVEGALRLACEFRLVVDGVRVDAAHVLIGKRVLRGVLPEGPTEFLVHVQQTPFRTRYVLQMGDDRTAMDVHPFPRSARRRSELRVRSRPE